MATLDDRISVSQNRLTGRWRVYIGERVAYHCTTWAEAQERADQLATQQRKLRADRDLYRDLYRERHGEAAA